jgi:Fic family protein
MKFFLSGVIETAKNGITTFDGIMQLQQQVEHDLQSLGSRAANAQKVVRYLYRRPILAAEKVSKVAEVSMPTAYKLVSSLEDLDILKEVTGAERNRLYIFQDYLNLFK